MRIFLALFPSPAVQEAAHRIIERLRRPDDDVSWVKRENLHYTLRFMGELDEEGVSRVIAAGRLGVAERPPFTASLGKVGAFPGAHRARVLWLVDPRKDFLPQLRQHFRIRQLGPVYYHDLPPDHGVEDVGGFRLLW